MLWLVVIGLVLPVAAAVAAPPYGEVKLAIEASRLDLATRYEAAPTDSARAAALDSACIFLQAALTEQVFPRWLGTAWSFDGTSESPGEGSTACGYFVTTCLRDAGFRLPRVELAQKPAEMIIRRLIPSAVIRRTSRLPVERLVAEVEQLGDGIYIVGLDFHAGFLIVDGGAARFVHSSYARPYRVVNEDAVASGPLRDSEYRVVGRIVPDRDLAIAWLRGDPVGEK